MARSTWNGGRRRARKKKKDDKYFALSSKPLDHNRSPLSDVPPDILHLVADLLDFRTFCALRRTCRGIWNWLQKMFINRYGPDRLTQDLSFDSMDSSRKFIGPMFASKIVSIEFFASDFDNARIERDKLTLHPNSRAMRKLRDDTRHMELASTGVFATMLAEWLSKFPNLKIIRLQNEMPPFVKGGEVVHEAVPLGSWPFSTLIAAVSRANIHLYELSLHDTRETASLDHSLIRTGGTIADVGVLRNLKTMRLQFYEHFPKWTHYRRLQQAIHSAPSLESLALISRGRSDTPGIGMNYLARTIEVPNLKTLIINGSINGGDLKKLLKKHLNTLREFRIMTGISSSPNVHMLVEFIRTHLSLDVGQPMILYENSFIGLVLQDD